MLQAVSAEQRKGRVFHLLYRSREKVGQKVLKFGAAALVKVGMRTKANGEGGSMSVPRYAGCHDLRRSFGERWAGRVMPQVLMALMRHETMQTTLAFYVGKNAERTADAVFEAYERAFANTLASASTSPPKGQEQPPSQSDATSQVK